RPSLKDGRDAHPTFKSGSYLILIPKFLFLGLSREHIVKALAQSFKASGHGCPKFFCHQIPSGKRLTSKIYSIYLSSISRSIFS
ncbi:hypothetical protein QUA67_28195, partial [Microcoleus sp. M2_C5]